MSAAIESTPPKQVGDVRAVTITKVLAIGTLMAPLTPEQMAEIMPHEVPATLELYLGGVIEQLYSRQDGKGPLFVLNTGSIKAAQEATGKLPLVQEKLLEFDFIELGPLRPLRLLLEPIEGHR